MSDSPKPGISDDELDARLRSAFARIDEMFPPHDPEKTLAAVRAAVENRRGIEMSVIGNPPGCDSPTPASRIGDVCRCLVCSRCGHHTGNATQGHYWAYCQATKTLRDAHMCCPGNCELENPTVVAWTPTRERLFRAIKRGFVVETGADIWNTVTGRKVNAAAAELVAARLAEYQPTVDNRAPLALTEEGERWLDTYGKNGEST